MAGKRTTIAIVDDDGGVRTALRELLKSMGYDAITFSSAEEFLSADDGTLVQCVIADVHLPGMSGPALVQALHASDRRLPAVLITAHDDPLTLDLIHAAGPVPHLHKPFSDDQLVDAIRRATAA
jgi:FixJ family two-component response regulator